MSCTTAAHPELKENYLVKNINALELYLKHVFKFTETQAPPVLSRNV